MRQGLAKTWLAAFCALALVALSASNAYAATKKVDCDNGKSIQKELDGTKDGDTVEVSGSCIENITITKDSIELIAVSGASITAADNANDTITVLGRNVRIQGFSPISGGNNAVIVRRGGSAVIEGNTIQNADNTGVRVTGSSYARIAGNTITDNGTTSGGFFGEHGIALRLSSAADILGNFITNNARENGRGSGLPFAIWRERGGAFCCLLPLAWRDRGEGGGWRGGSSAVRNCRN
ncbi:MAG: right-handed parallel beta-helix repeat-containing protein [Candidatus Methylomirabilales bacterium]